jgi:glycerol-3-phosphate cytidylyltransferase
MSYTNKSINGFTAGAFDLLHPGHLSMLAECKEKCDYLIVGLHTDPTIDRPGTKNKPVQTMYERYVQLISCRYVDCVVPYDTEKDLENLLGTLDINKRFVGIEYEGTPITGIETCNLRDIHIVYTSRYHSYSTSELRKRIENAGRRV